MEWIERLRRYAREEMMSPEERIERAGRLAETKVNRVLEEMEREGQIKDYTHSPKWSEKDRRGIDFTIYPREGSCIYIQVKSNIFPISTAKQLRLRKIRPGIWQRGKIYSIAAGNHESEEQVKNTILKILEIEKNQKQSKRKGYKQNKRMSV
ncbi:hypothetical protein J7J39_00140 [bacterium]|nr:hypothetical protein [bacterium]